MWFRMHRPFVIFTVFQILFSITSAVPHIGIQADFLNPSGKDSIADQYIQSYSAVIKFNDGGIPQDKTRMTDAKLLHLAVVAYNEMVAIWRARNIRSDLLPGAMAVIASGDKLYFASALRTVPNGTKLKDVPQGSIKEKMDDALTMGIGTHSHGGGCGEINCLELFWASNKKQDPPVGPPKPRVAIWVLPKNKKIDTNSEKNVRPCTWESLADPGYGCQEIALAYSLDPIDSTVTPDAAGDDWDIALQVSIRPPCQQ